MAIGSKRSLKFFGLMACSALLLACSTVEQTASEQQSAPVKTFDTNKPASYEEYKAWRDQFDPAAKEYADFKAWEEQYRRWQWEQRQ